MGTTPSVILYPKFSALLIIVTSAALAADCNSIPLPAEIHCSQETGTGLLIYNRQNFFGQSPRILQWLEGIGVSPPFDRSVALLVGIGSYNHPPLNTKPLPAKKDVEAVRNFLLLEEKFDTVYVLLDEDATATQIDNLMMRALDETGKIRRGDRFLFYFSGHGTDVGSGVGYMLFSNYTGEYDRETALPVNVIEQWSRKIPAKHVLFLLDGCSTGLGIVSKGSDVLARRTGDGSRVAYTATRGNEAARADKMSLFTAAFLEVVRKGLADKMRAGFMTIHGVADEVESRLAKNLNSTQAYYDKEPVALPVPNWIRHPGEFVFIDPKVDAAVNVSTKIKEWFPVKGTLPPTEKTLISLSTGWRHTCGNSRDGSTYCWGNNAYGQLGTGDFSYSPQPSLVLSPGDLVFNQISAGHDHTCALDGEGRAWCWGGNALRQLGTNEVPGTPIPVKVSWFGKFASISAGDQFTCAITDDSKLVCWGRWNIAILPSEPRIIAEGLRFTQVSAGYKHACAVAKSGQVYCWGEYWTPKEAKEPVVKTGASLVFKKISSNRIESASALGASPICGITIDEKLYCWSPLEDPRLLAAGQKFTSVEVAQNRILAISQDGKLLEFSDLGSVPLLPETVRFDGKVSGVALCSKHACLLDSDARIFCWGDNTDGELGTGTIGVSTVPEPVIPFGIEAEIK